MGKFEPFFAQLQRGDRLYIPGSSAEPREFVEALGKAARDLPHLQITNSFVPGINTLPLAADDNSLTETVVFPRGKALMHSGRVNFLPLSYFDAAKYLQRQSFEWAVLQVSPPDDDGNCSLGASVEFIPTILKRSKHLLGLVNANVPQVAGSPKIAAAALDMMVEIHSPLVAYRVGDTDPVSSRIAEHLQGLLESGAVLQLGLGNIPAKLAAGLNNFRNLRIHSGMVSDGFLTLLDQGVLDPDFAHTTCCALGTQEFYNALPSLSQLTIRGVEETHAPASLCRYQNLIAINSALEVDLWGQANLEMLGTRQISSVGGAADFARAARSSSAGKSIIALPATAANGQQSRIVGSFQPNQIISLSRAEVDFVVTEFGVAELTNQPVAKRGEALIAIAAPQFREQLGAAWQTLLGGI